MAIWQNSKQKSLPSANEQIPINLKNRRFNFKISILTEENHNLYSLNGCRRWTERWFWNEFRVNLECKLLRTVGTAELRLWMWFIFRLWTIIYLSGIRMTKKNKLTGNGWHDINLKCIRRLPLDCSGLQLQLVFIMHSTNVNVYYKLFQFVPEFRRR